MTKFKVDWNEGDANNYWHLQHNNKLLQLTVHNSVLYIFHSEEFLAVLLHARIRYIKQPFYTI